MKPLRLSPKRFPKRLKDGDRILEQEKKYFFHNMNNTQYFLDRKISYAKFDGTINTLEECWIKFTFGSEEFHNTMRIDFSRVFRLHWIFQIINYINNTDLMDYDPILTQQYESAKRFSLYVDLKNEVYKIVLEETNQDEIVIITAFTKFKKKSSY